MADAFKENADPSSRAARASKRAGRSVLRWGETLESLFLLSPEAANAPERKALAERVVQRPDDPAAWWHVLQDIPAAIKPDARCRLFRRATQSIPKNRPELYESEAYVSIWLGFAVEQAKLGQRQEGADALEYMRSEGIGKRSRAFYETWALCEVAAGQLAKGRAALKAGLRALPTRERPPLQELAKCTDAELREKSGVLAGAVKVCEDATGVVSVNVGRAQNAGMDTGDDTVVLPPPAPSSQKAPMKREDIDYMLKWKPSLGRAKPRAVSFARGAKASVSPEDETCEAPRSTMKTSSSASTTSSHAVEEEDDSSDSDAGVTSASATPVSARAASPFADLIGDRNAVTVDGATYAKLALVGRGGSSKVFRVLSSDGRVLALKRIKLKETEIEHSFAGYANEITLLRRLAGKPGIVRLFAADISKDTGSIHMVMEAGEADLATVLTRTRNEKGYCDGNFARLAWQQMLEAVQTIHEERIVHGDLKPANFLFVQGRLKLIDFGIARAIKNDTTNIYRDTQIGTLNYMSPEAIRDSGAGAHKDGKRRPSMRVGRASDVWSLGCILYQMVYGKTPFGDLHLYAKLQAITDARHKIATPTKGALATPDALDCVRGCLERNPAERLQIGGDNGLLTHAFLDPRATRVTSVQVKAAVDAALIAQPEASVNAASLARDVHSHLVAKPGAPGLLDAIRLGQGGLKSTALPNRHMKDTPEVDAAPDGLAGVLARGFASMAPVAEEGTGGSDMDVTATTGWTTGVAGA